MLYYTGIGSRKTPKDILKIMYNLGKELGQRNLCLRSGKAEGADTYFQLGAQDAEAKMQIYIPWNNFNSTTEYNKEADRLHHNKDINAVNLKYWAKAKTIARDIHPNWDNCSLGAIKLHTRNVFQILGKELKNPSKFVLYWAKEINGKTAGGTATAIEVAKMNNIPVINLKYEGWLEKLNQQLSVLNIKLVKGDNL